MKPKDAHKVASRCASESCLFWGIDPHWEITLEEGRLDEGTLGWVGILPDYRRASIMYDLGQHDDLTHVWSTIAHEMAHIAQADYQMAFDTLCAGREATPQERAVFRHAQERVTMMLEHVFVRERPYAPARKSR